MRQLIRNPQVRGQCHWRSEGGQRQVLRMSGCTEARYPAEDGRGSRSRSQVAAGVSSQVSTVDAHLCRQVREDGREGCLPAYISPPPQVEGIQSGSCHRRSMWLMGCWIVCFLLQKLARLAGNGLVVDGGCVAGC